MVGHDRRGGSGGAAFRVATLILVFMVTTIGTLVGLVLTWALGPWLLPTLWRWVFVLPAAVILVASILMWRSGLPWPRTAAAAMMLVLGVGVWILLADGTWSRLAKIDRVHSAAADEVCSRPAPEGTDIASCGRSWSVDFSGASTTCFHEVRLLLNGDPDPSQLQGHYGDLGPDEIEEAGPRRYELRFELNYIGRDLRCGPR